MAYPRQSVTSPTPGRLTPQPWTSAALLLASAASALGAQERAVPPDTTRELMAEIRFDSRSTDTVSVRLERGIAYRAELTGPGTPVFQPRDTRSMPALVVPVRREPEMAGRAFEVHAYQTRPHLVTVTDRPEGASGTLRLYRDIAGTRRLRARRDRRIATGALVAGGYHTGYRLDPTGGEDPRGGTDLEACLLVEAGGWLGGCPGAGRQSLPDAGYAFVWLFLEARARLLTRQLLGSRRTDLGVAVRIGQGLDAGSRALDPELFALGLYVRQHLAAGGQRRGWSVVGAWHHVRLGNVPETELLDADRFTAGLAWVP